MISFLSNRFASQQALSFRGATVILYNSTATLADLDQILTYHQHPRPHIPTLKAKAHHHLYPQIGPIALFSLQR